MPELPEVETVRRGLESRLIDATVVDVVVRDRRLRWPVAADFETQLRGQRVVAIERRSKYLLFRLTRVEDTEKSTLLAHLGMTGSFVVHCRFAAGLPVARPRRRSSDRAPRVAGTALQRSEAVWINASFHRA